MGFAEAIAKLNWRFFRRCIEPELTLSLLTHSLSQPAPCETESVVDDVGKHLALMTRMEFVVAHESVDRAR